MRLARRAGLIGVAVVAGVIAAACSGGHGGGGGGPTPTPSPSATPPGCDTQWRVNDAAYAPDLLADLVSGGAATVSNGTLVLTFTGTLPANSGTSGRYQTAALFSKRVLTADFDAFVRLQSLTVSNTNLGAAFAVQAQANGLAGVGPHGERFVVDTQPGGYEVVEDDYYGGTPGEYRSSPAASGVVPSFFRFSRRDIETFTIATAGNGSDNGYSYDPNGGDATRVIGFGIANVAVSPAPVTGSITARFTGLGVVDTAGNCFTSGLQ